MSHKNLTLLTNHTKAKIKKLLPIISKTIFNSWKIKPTLKFSPYDSTPGCSIIISLKSDKPVPLEWFGQAADFIESFLQGYFYCKIEREQNSKRKPKCVNKKKKKKKMKIK